jgi:basic membrane protein A and related proteins
LTRLVLQTLAVAAVLAVAVASGSAGGGTAVRPLRVVAVNPPGIPFKGARDDPVLRGLRRAVKEFDVEGRAVTLGAKENFAAALSSLAAQRYDLVIAGTGDFLESVETVAPRFPETTFLMTDTPVQSLRKKHSNVAGTDFRQQEASYLGGYLAALMVKGRGSRAAISSVGGIKVPPVDSLVAGYQAGARKALRGITTLNGYANSFSDPAKCRAIAVNQIARGSGVVFQVAGGCGLGSLAAAKEKGVWGIGVDDDQSYLGAHILTSVLKRFDVATFRAIQALVKDRFPRGRNIVLNLLNGGVGLGKISPKVPRPFVAQVERIRRQIVAGKIRNIPTTVP